MTTGSVAPISVVGMMSTAKAAANLANVITGSEEGSEGCVAIQMSLATSSRAGVAKAVAPMPISISPNTMSGERRRPASRPAE